MNSPPTQLGTTAAENDEQEALQRMICDGLAPIALPPGAATGLRSRLLQRVGDSARRHAGLITVRTGEGTWRKLIKGVRSKLLHTGADGASVLIELAAGAVLPVHRHQHLEEGIVLRGSLQLGDLNLVPGDYHVSPPGSRHGRISSRSGGLAYLRGSSLGHTRAALGELIGGLLPGAGPATRTVHAADDDWQTIADGVEEKILWRAGDVVSRFYRLAAGSRLPAHGHAHEEEWMLLAGDAYFGDILVRAGEFHLAPAGSTHGELSSEHGAVAFVRGHAIVA
ncbi:cupin domain-containing protein [Accumulibacter sp.]|uniref:cupin domain-containing protein n=1 Tax=Accumulibacter sp. TaxID=2053492 RepID=UPI0025FDB6E5|nr:cupin domain-containing protein [Accumulibacter sp.]MCM8614170.1 cupin domain-containing protein [Accumulibacter sp.]MCM8637937.1 cupin domain-containing protein [Accumulibacter sp.]MCM8641406.1 cupin domain-containing protein [Accumulibacter sp.]